VPVLQPTPAPTVAVGALPTASVLPPAAGPLPTASALPTTAVCVPLPPVTTC
jgi:hypothetical protein